MSKPARRLEQTIRPNGLVRWRPRWAILTLFPRLLGAVLLLAGSQKALDDSGVVRVLEYDRVPQVLIAPMVSAVIVIECFVGGMLLLRPRLRWVIDIAIALLAVYTAQLAYLAIFRDAPQCNCLAAWQTFRSARVGNLLGVGRNLCLVLALLWVRVQQSAAIHTSGTSRASP